ncbi:MAG: glycosyltransferase family 39 protein [bacterium JZ-2024 1]
MGAQLRFYALGRPSFWADEGFTYYVSGLPIRELLGHTVEKDFNPPLFYIVMSAWRHLTAGIPGSLEALFRTPAVLIDLLLMGLIFRWTLRNLGPTVALYAGLFFAFLPLEIEAARTARPYTMFSLWTFIALSHLIDVTRTSQKPRSRSLLTMSVAHALALFTHYYGWLVLIASAAILIQFGKRKHLPWLLIPPLLYTPWIPFFVQHFYRGNPMIAELTIWRLARACGAILLGQTSFLRAEGVDMVTVALALVILIFAGALLWRGLSVPTQEVAILSYVSVVWLFFVPTVASIVVNAFEEFYFVMVLPFLVVILAAGASRSASPRSILLFIALLFLGGIYPQYSYEHQAWRDVARAVHRKYHEGDIIVYNIWFDVYPAHHYIKRAFASPPRESGLTDETFEVSAMQSLLSRCRHLILVGSYDRNLESRRLRSWLIHNRKQIDIQLFAHTFVEKYSCLPTEPNGKDPP